MQDRYHDLIEKISQLIADRLFEDADRLDDEQALELDALMFNLMMQIGLAALQKLIEKLVTRRVEKCRREGMHIAKSGNEIRPTTKLGTLEVASPYLRNPHTGQTARPAKDKYGLVGQGKTPSLERALSDFGSECSYGEAEKRFEEHYGFCIGRTSILRVTNAVGEDAEQYLEHRLDQKPQPNKRTVDEMMVQVDGCAIRTGKYMTAMQAGWVGEDKYEAGDLVRKQQWREVRVGLVRCRGEATKQYVAQMGDYEQLCDQLHALAESKGLGDETFVISPGDGGNGLKEAIEETFDDVQFILDFSHLRDHFYETAEAIGIGDDLRNEWVDDFLDSIWEGKLEEALDRLRTLFEQTEHNRLDRLIRYLKRFADCVDYSIYENAGWPTGSGEVESAHKYVPQARLKLPGACWRAESINPMLAIRVIKKNGWWDDFWCWRIDNQNEAA